jgi:hypothetical protein
VSRASKRDGRQQRHVVSAAIALLAGVAAACGRSPAGVEDLAPAPTAAATPVPSPTPLPSPSAAANQAPVLDLRLKPRPIRGAAPLSVSADLCRSVDPDGDTLHYAHEWAGEGKQLSTSCSASHTYAAPIRSRAYFCAWDGHPEHLACLSFDVDVY